MKRIIIILATAAILPSTAAHAYEYPYLTFEQSDGTQTTVSVEQLVLTISGENLLITNNDGSQTLPLSELSRMFFATSGTTAISDTPISANEEVEVYTVSGVHMGHFDNIAAARQSLPHGIYILKTQQSTQKITIQ